MDGVDVCISTIFQQIQPLGRCWASVFSSGGDFFSFMTMCKKIMQKKLGDIKKKLGKMGGDTDFQDKSFTNFLV
jgi:hypothetical protein